MKSRRYRNDLGFVEGGFRSCRKNFDELAEAASTLLDAGWHAPALSLAVLALEEIGKLMALDGLLFAQSMDVKSAFFKQSNHDHDTKLRAVHYCGLFISKYAEIDPRWKTDELFQQAVGIAFSQLTQSESRMLKALGADDLSSLNSWKQLGFYVRVTAEGLRAPSESVSEESARLVVAFAQQLTGNFKFVLNDQTIDEYFALARRIRGRLSEHDHQNIEQYARALFEGSSSEGEAPSVN